MASIRSPGCHDASKVVQCLERFLVDEQEPHEASELKRTHRDSLIHFNVSPPKQDKVPARVPAEKRGGTRFFRGTELLGYRVGLHGSVRLELAICIGSL